MSDNKPGTNLTAQELEQVGGGCTVEEIQGVIDNLKENYEALIDFASYLIERVAGK